MNRTTRVIAIAAVTALASCGPLRLPAATPTVNTVTLHFDTTTATYPLLRDFVDAYSLADPRVSFETSTASYRTLLNRLVTGEAPYFLSNHLPVDSPLWAAPVAQDGIAVITYAGNPVSGLTSDQLRRIFQGWITNWSQVGGEDLQITVFSREDGSGTRAEFGDLIMGTRPITPAARVAPSSAAMLTGVSGLPGSIGYVSMGYLPAGVQALAIDGSLPTPASVAGNIYPLRSTIFVVGLGEPVEAYRAFIGWMQSGPGQIVAGLHYASFFAVTPEN